GESRVLVKEFLLDPVTEKLLHADFYRVNMDRKITVTVQIVTKGEPRGVKLEGGILDFVHREIDIETLPGEIPDHIEVDVTNLGLNDAVYVRDVVGDAKWTPVQGGDLMLLHIITPRAVEEPVAAEPTAAVAAVPGAAAEPEVIKKGKVEAEGEEKKDKDKDKKDKK
ncbi:MAG: 50S ribosomal protein L25, partial [Vicinamibacterales bacterium]